MFRRLRTDATVEVESNRGRGEFVSGVVITFFPTLAAGVVVAVDRAVRVVLTEATDGALLGLDGLAGPGATGLEAGFCVAAFRVKSGLTPPDMDRAAGALAPDGGVGLFLPASSLAAAALTLPGPPMATFGPVLAAVGLRAEGAAVLVSVCDSFDGPGRGRETADEVDAELDKRRRLSPDDKSGGVVGLAAGVLCFIPLTGAETVRMPPGALLFAGVPGPGRALAVRSVVRLNCVVRVAADLTLAASLKDCIREVVLGNLGFSGDFAIFFADNGASELDATRSSTETSISI